MLLIDIKIRALELAINFHKTRDDFKTGEQTILNTALNFEKYLSNIDNKEGDKE